MIKKYHDPYKCHKSNNMNNRNYSFYAIVIIVGTIFSNCGMDKAGSAYKDSADYNKELAETKTKLNKTIIPKEVTGKFHEEYPLTTYDYWFGYPTLDYQNDWYNSDHEYNNNSPTSYIVEFDKDNTSYKAVYTKTGKRIATHKSISTLPDPVSLALNNGDYKTWTIGIGKEEIFKDKDSDKLKVYKVTASMGGQKHLLYYESNGKLIKDEKVS